MNPSLPMESVVTPVSSPLALGIRNFSGIHYDPHVPVNPPAAPAAPPAAPVVAPSPGDGSVATPPVASLEENPGFKQLRAQYEQTKAEADKWKKLGNFDDVSQLHTGFQQKLTQASTMGKALGYTEDQIRNAMYEDPKGTLLFLQQEYAKPASATHEDLDKRLKSMLDEQVKPIQQRFDETINREANARYEGERDRLYKTEFADGLPDDNREELFEILDSLVSNDAAALTRLKFQNQVSDIARHMTQAKVIFMKRHNSYIAHEKGRGQAPPNGRAPVVDPNAKKPWQERTLSDGTPLKAVFGR